MTLLIIGGTGTLGRQLVKKALVSGFKVQCLVRNQKKANFIKKWGAELVYGDLTLPETLPFTFLGSDAIIDASTTRVNDIINISEVDYKSKITLIKLAEIAQIKRFIFFSIVGAQKSTDVPLMSIKAEIETAIQKSKLPFTIFRVPGFYQALINQYAIPILDNQPIWTTDEKFSTAYIDTEDTSKICLKSLTNKKISKTLYTISGPKNWLSQEIIQTCEQLSGQTAQVKLLPISTLKFIQKIIGLFEWSLNIYQRLAFIKILEYSSNSKIDNESSSNLYKLLQIDKDELLVLEDYLKDYFEKILKTLKDLNYEKTLKRRDLTL